MANEVDQKEILGKVQEITNQPKSTVESVVYYFLYELAKNIASAGRIEMKDFGVMSLKKRTGRKGVTNGKFGPAKEYAKPDYLEVEFNPSPEFLKLLNENLPEGQQLTVKR